MGKIPSINSLNVEVHEIGFFVVFDEVDNALGVIHVSGFLDDLSVKFNFIDYSLKVDGTCAVVIASRYGVSPYCLDKPLVMRALADKPENYEFCFVSFPIQRGQSIRVLVGKVRSVGEIKVFGHLLGGLWAEYTPLGYKNKLRTPQIFVCSKNLPRPRSPKFIERLVSYDLIL